MFKILVTGAKGFIGEKASSYFREAGYEVISPSHTDLDVTDSVAVSKFFAENTVDFIFHTAARGGFREEMQTAETVENNLRMFENLVLHRTKVKLILCLGSGDEFDHKYPIMNVGEERLGSIVPSSYYGLSKYVIANRIISLKENIVNFRLFNVFGEKETSYRFIKAAVSNYIDKKPITIFNNIWMDFFYIDDLFKIGEYYFKNWGNKTLPHDLNICYDKKYMLADIVKIINSLDDYEVPVSSGLYSFSAGRDYTGDGALLKNLSIKIGGLEEGIRKMYNFLNEEKIT